ncbi:MAG TPA: T9SS type A sorting domain-containing protein [bacterium]|jgi:hypothetical protein
MKHKRYWMLLVLVVGLVMGTQQGLAQCRTSAPAQLNLYQSYCVHVCPDSVSMFFLSCPFMGPEMFPHLTLSPGCQGNGGDCNSDCTPVMPPAWPWTQGQAPEFGQDPSQPDAIYLTNDCLDMYVYWSHNGYWVVEIYGKECSGCFCMWFDWQLPVELSSFDAVVGDSKVTLSWRTASESANDRFEIVREDRGVVTAVRSAGNGPSGHSYTWTDSDVVNGRRYTYRLRAVDYNGQVDNLRTIDATPSFTQMAVTDFALHQNYPNPFNPTTHIQFDVPASSLVKLDIYNPLGQHIESLVDGVMSVGRYTASFDGANLQSGLYFFTIKMGDRFTATRKMLLVK